MKSHRGKGCLSVGTRFCLVTNRMSDYFYEVIVDGVGVSVGGMGVSVKIVVGRGVSVGGDVGDAASVGDGAGVNVAVGNAVDVGTAVEVAVGGLVGVEVGGGKTRVT